MRVKVTELGPIVAWVLGLCVGMIVAGRFVEAAGPGAWWLRLITLLASVAATGMMVRARRDAERYVEWDQIGVRCHGGERSWDVPWGLVARLEVRRRIGQRKLFVHADPSLAGQPFAVVSPLPRGKVPGPPAVHFPHADRPRAVIKGYQVRRWVLYLIAPLLVAAVVVGVARASDFAMMMVVIFFLVMLGVAGGVVPYHLVIDQFGIRRLGENRWLLAWPQIASARMLDGTLVVSPRDGGGPGLQITDGQPLDEAIRKLDRRHFQVPMRADQTVPVQQLIDSYALPRWRSDS